MAVKRDDSASDLSSLTPDFMESLSKILNEDTPALKMLKKRYSSADFPKVIDYGSPFKRDHGTYHWEGPKDAPKDLISSGLSGHEITSIFTDEIETISKDKWSAYLDKLVESYPEKMREMYFGDFQEENIATKKTKSSKQQSQQDKPTQEAAEVW